MPPSPTRRRARPPRMCPLIATALAMGLSGCAGAPVAENVRVAAASIDSFAVGLFGPAGPRTRRLSVAPPPAAKPARPLLQTIAARDPRDGMPVRLVPRAVGARSVEVRQSDGCLWRRDDWFAPSRFWRGCGDSRNWRDGEATVSGGAGLWPLRLGAEGRFTRRAVSGTGRRLERETVCRVSDAVEVLRDGRAPTPAFVVDCADGKRVRTTWWAPGVGPVAFRKTHDEKGIEEVWAAD